MPRKTKETSKEPTKNVIKKIAKKTKTTKTNIKTNTVKTTVSNKKLTKKDTAKAIPADTKASKAKTNVASKSTKVTSKAVQKAKAIAEPAEYYDLPYRYNETIVKILAQTPTTLFVYWDISDKDRENYKKLYGEHFFENTKPVLVVHNTTMGYSFETEINDFANSWYLHINDSKCDYTIELGRRPINDYVEENAQNNSNQNEQNASTSRPNTNYIYIASSNQIETPNDRILFNTDEHQIYVKNVKNNVTSTKSVSFIKNMGKIYNIYDLYKEVYKDETIEDLPTSSTFK